MIKVIKNNIFFFLIIFYLLVNFNFFENSYKILSSNYENRLIDLYGLCGKESYGFVKKNKEDRIITNFKLINKDKNYPSIRGLFYSYRENIMEENYIFLLNEGDKASIKKNYKNFKIINEIENCFLLKKND
tara:strand:+ start:640 stop:1032 length:393 start_codon:yes stop_codon:yes gene_type:complete